MMTDPAALDFRPATQADAEAIRDLVRAAYARWVPVIGREPMPMQADYATQVAQHQFTLAQDRSRLVGLIETETRVDHLWIENVAVHPDQQGKGIGRALLAVADQQAVAAGVGEVRLLTNEAFASNVALYLATGYQIERREDFRGGVTVYMRKAVTV